MSDEEVRDAIVKEYAQGNLTQDEIAQKHGININILRNWLYRSAKTNNGETIDITGLVKEERIKFEMDGHSFSIGHGQLRKFLEAIGDDKV